MASIKYSGFVHDISGKIGGTTFQRNAFGHTVRNKPSTARPQSIRQINQQALMTTVINAWNALSIEERTKWDRAVSFYLVYAKKNSSSLLSGRAFFLQYNLTALSAGKPLILSPSYLTPNWTNYALSMLCVGTSHLFLISDSDLVTNNQYMLTSFSRKLEVSAPVRRQDAHVCKLIKYSNNHYDIIEDYVAIYGQFGNVSQYLDVWFTVFHTDLPAVFFEQYTRILVEITH